jgi:putative ATP-binding cassette transporter
MPPTRAARQPRFLAITLPFFRSEARGRALALLGLLLAFILGLNALSVTGSYFCGDFTTAVAERHAGVAVHFALLWAGVLGTITVVHVFKAFTEERLRLWWRQWLTRHLFGRYLTGRAYYAMKARTDVDNPDQRITEDVKTFTEQALALLLIGTNATITLISYSAVLWSITPWLFAAAVGYTLFGSTMTVLLGRRLMRLDVLQFKKEADLRYDLIQVRTHAEPVALLSGEPEEGLRLGRRLGAAVENMKAVIGLSRNIGFFTVGFDYLIPVIPLFVVAPLYVRGEAPFGIMAQAQLAFLNVMGAFSIIVKEFQRISTFGAVVERLGKFNEALDEETPGLTKSPIEVVVDPSRVAFEGLTLVTPREGRLLVKDLWVQVPRGQRLLVLGPSGSGRTCLLRAAAGLWTCGQGRVVRPPQADVVFLPQQPYLRAGTLRDQLVYGCRHGDIEVDRVLAVLHKVGFGEALERVGGLNVERDWAGVLALGEQQQVAVARLLLAEPAFAFLDEPTSALDEARASQLYEVLRDSPISYVSVASDPRLRSYHDRVIELGPDGSWLAYGRPGPALDGRMVARNGTTRQGPARGLDRRAAPVVRPRPA